MTKILIEGYSHITSFDLSEICFVRLATVLPISVRTKLSRDISQADLAWCDILLCIRGDNPLSAYLAERASAAGRKVIILLDDDLFEYSDGRKWWDKVRRKSLRSVLSVADFMITPSAYLGEKYHRLCGIDYVVSHTIVQPEEMMPERESVSGLVRIVYAAGTGHKVFFDQLVSPVLNKLHDRYGDGIALTVIGPDVNTGDSGLACEKVPSMPMEQYRDYMKTHPFDIGLAPLLDFEMGRSKYFNKYLEYSTQGICGVYSNVLPYAPVIQDGENGFLAENDPESWYQAISRAVDNAELRKKCLRTARERILRDHSLERVTDIIRKGIPFFCTYSAPVARHLHIRPMMPFFLFVEFRRRYL